MSSLTPRKQPPAILAGLILLARGRAEGFAHFGSSTQMFLASLAPWIAFPLVGSVIVALGGYPAQGFISFLETICVLLAQPVISEALAERWQRRERWLRYATAFNWCQWLLPLLAGILLVPVRMLLSLGLPPDAAALLLLAIVVVYALWLEWFLARRGLEVSGTRAALLVVLINLGTALLLLFPRLIIGFG